MGDDIIIRLRGGGGSYSTDHWLHLERLIMWFGPEMTEISTFPGDMLNILLSGWIYMNKFQKKYDKITKNSHNMVVNMYIIGPKKDQFKPVFFSLFDFFKMKRPRSRLQKTNKQSFLVLVLFGLSPVQLQSFASPRTGLSNTMCDCHESDGTLRVLITFSVYLYQALQWSSGWSSPEMGINCCSTIYLLYVKCIQ